MKKIILYSFIALVALSCGKENSKNKNTLLPHITGGMHDVIVVMSPSNWESEPGQVLKDTLLQPVPAIPQDEKLFDVVWIPHSAFDRGVKKQRNIIVTKIGPDHKEGIKIIKSLWAQSQLIINISAPTPEAFVELFKKNAHTITARIQQAELERLVSNYKKSSESGVMEKIENNHKIKLTVPTGYSINQEDENFIWLDYRHRNVIEGILIYYYPYIDSNTFSKDFLISKRNQILKQYIPGEVDGSYPITENRFPIMAKEFNMNGNNYTYELRGLWHMVDGMAMGGPFVSVTQYDKERQRIVTVDGFLFAAGEEKRNLIKRLEAILYSLDFPDEE